MERRKSTFWVGFLRFWLTLMNLVVAAAGLAMVGWAIKMYIDVKHAKQPPASEAQMLWASLPFTAARGQSIWFVWAFGGTGLFTFLTALSGFVGVAINSPRLLGLYSTMLGTLLIFQAALGILFFVDDSWRKHLPGDATGEAAEITAFLHKKLAIVKWVALGALVLQGLLLFLAYHLSFAQLRELEDASDEEDSRWGRQSLMPAASPRTSEPGSAGPSSATHGQRADPWSTRMRDKYGLDVDDFGYDPNARRPLPPANSPDRPAPASQSRYCSIM